MIHSRPTETLPEFDQLRTLERPDGFYWQDKTTEETYGPFPSIQEAIADAQPVDQPEETKPESLEEAEAEIGIAEWIDPETGEPAEESVPRLEDH
jgi:hypothetical protein